MCVHDCVNVHDCVIVYVRVRACVIVYVRVRAYVIVYVRVCVRACVIVYVCVWACVMFGNLPCQCPVSHPVCAVRLRATQFLHMQCHSGCVPHSPSTRSATVVACHTVPPHAVPHAVPQWLHTHTMWLQGL